MKEFSNVAVCKLHDNFLYNSIQFEEKILSLKVSERFVRMSLKEKGHIFVEVNQADGRFYKSDFSNFSHVYGRTRILIAKLGKDDEPC